MGDKIYVGGLAYDTRESDLDDVFYRYGRIRDVYIPRAGGFAFITFSDPRDADDAVRNEDGQMFRGRRLKVEISRRREDRGGRDRREGGRGAAPRSEFRVLVSGMQPRTHWQDLKDFVKTVCEPSFVKTFPNGSGVVEFTSAQDMEDAMKKLDDTDFKGERITLKQDTESAPPPSRGDDRRDRGRGRSPPRDRSRSPQRRSRSPRRRSRSPRRDRSDSRGRDRDRRANSQSPERR